MSADVLRVDAIRVEDRARRDYVNIDTLAASIASLGLIHPLLVTPDHRLIAGGRRLEAVKALGWDMVPVTVASNLTEASDLLQAESDENAEREPLKPSEAANLAAKIEAVLKPLAAERVGGRPSKTAANFAGVSEPRPRDVAAKAAGTSRESIRKVRHVQEVIESETTPEPVREIAKAALNEIDATGKVDAGHKRVREALTAAEAAAEFPDLAYYIEKGEPTTAVRLAQSLRGYEEPELSMRLNNLRLSIAAEKRRTKAPAEPSGPDYTALADRVFLAVNDAMQTVEKSGGDRTIREAVMTSSPEMVALWRSSFARASETLAALADAAKPTLRRVQ